MDLSISETVESQCLNVPPGYVAVFNGLAFQAYFHSPMPYNQAQDTCQAAGGALPTFKDERQYIGVKTAAGFSRYPILLGLKAGILSGCSSPDSCVGHLNYHHPGATSSPDDDTIWAFADEAWLAGQPMDIDAGDGECTTMGYGGSENYRIKSVDCADAHPFVCAFECASGLIYQKNVHHCTEEYRYNDSFRRLW